MTDYLEIRGKKLELEVNPGVFSQYGIDEGSKLLLEAAEIPSEGNILDLGCGCGVLGLAAALCEPGVKVLMVDSDIRAVRLSRRNTKKNNLANVIVEIGDVNSDIPENMKFDLVLSNPPTHQGKSVVMEFLEGSHNVLNKGGVAYFVVNRMESVLKKMEDVYGNSQKIAKRNGFIVFRAVKKG